MTRTEQDCANGDDTACALLDALHAPPAKADRPVHPTAPDRTQVSKDVDAILDGIGRAAAYAPSGQAGGSLER